MTNPLSQLNSKLVAAGLSAASLVWDFQSAKLNAGNAHLHTASVEFYHHQFRASGKKWQSLLFLIILFSVLYAREDININIT